VDENDRHHEIRAPTVQCADEPAKGDIVIEALQTAPGFASRWNVDEREKNARHDLQEEYGERSAAEDVPPTCGVSRHGVLGNFANRSRELQATIKPFADLD